MATQEKIAKKYLKAFGPESVIAYARWTPSSSATQTLTEAFGVDTITRSAAGTYSINLQNKCKAITPFVMGIQNDGLNKCAVTVESTSATAGTVAIKQWSGTGSVTVGTQLADVSAESSAYCVAPVAGTVYKVRSALGGAITVANAVVTTNINGTPITNGSLTVAYSGSAAGDVDVATPTAANTVAAGDLLTATSDGGSTDTATLDIVYEIIPTLSDTACDEIVFIAIERLV